ncbi:nuclear transport factor 2 family protein [Phyllobacterium sp. LjRoot231]|uniref:nuclear transport factor 2 family protein n=1 Tax=Phyllobacterium sp. LjRoot231 TaxID=3342289 RepID=UPI003ECE404A
MPDVHYGNEQHFVDSDTETGISKWTLTGTNPDGTRKEVRGCDFYTFRDGKHVRARPAGRS